MKARPSDRMSSLRGAALSLVMALFCCPPARAQLAVVHSFSGSVLLERSASGPWAPLQLVPERLQAGGKIKAGPDGAAEVRFADNSRVIVERGGDFSLDA